MIALIYPEPDQFVVEYLDPTPVCLQLCPGFADTGDRPGVILAQSSKIASSGGEEQLQEEKKTAMVFPDERSLINSWDLLHSGIMYYVHCHAQILGLTSPWLNAC